MAENSYPKPEPESVVPAHPETAALRALLAETTDGPWVDVTDNGRKDGIVIVGALADRGTGRAIAVFSGTNGRRRADARLLVTARNELLGLLDLFDAQAAELAETHARLEGMRQFRTDEESQLRRELQQMQAERDRALQLLEEIATEDAAFVERELAKAREEWAKDPTWHPAPHKVDGRWHPDHTGHTCAEFLAGAAGSHRHTEHGHPCCRFAEALPPPPVHATCGGPPTCPACKRSAARIHNPAAAVCPHPDCPDGECIHPMLHGISRHGWPCCGAADQPTSSSVTCIGPPACGTCLRDVDGIHNLPALLPDDPGAAHAGK